MSRVGSLTTMAMEQRAIHRVRITLRLSRCEKGTFDVTNRQRRALGINRLLCGVSYRRRDIRSSSRSVGLRRTGDVHADVGAIGATACRVLSVDVQSERATVLLRASCVIHRACSFAIRRSVRRRALREVETRTSKNNGRNASRITLMFTWSRRERQPSQTNVIATHVQHFVIRLWQN